MHLHSVFMSFIVRDVLFQCEIPSNNPLVLQVENDYKCGHFSRMRPYWLITDVRPYSHSSWVGSIHLHST